MSWTLSIISLSLWFVGVTVPYTLHGHIHLFLALAIGIVMIPAVFDKHFKGD